MAALEQALPAARTRQSAESSVVRGDERDPVGVRGPHQYLREHRHYPGEGPERDRVELPDVAQVNVRSNIPLRRYWCSNAGYTPACDLPTSGLKPVMRFADREGRPAASSRASSSSSEWPLISAVLVVVPAHDEQERIGACVRSVRQAAEAVAGLSSSEVTTCSVRQVEIVVALDRCTDGTAAAVADASVHFVHLDAGCVGAARRAGVGHGAALTAAHEPRAVLVVNTDADCVVPRDWLIDLVSLAAGHDVVLGEVQPDPVEMSPISLEAWWLRHPRGRGSLHGANLAVRLDAYLSVGGFAAVNEQEDVLLVRALRAAEARVVGGTRVMTSGRRQGRIPQGFAGYLRALDEELALQGESR